MGEPDSVGAGTTPDVALVGLAPALGDCRWLVLSPHLDDAALSCGGALAVWAAAGAAPAVVTICAGRPSGPLTDFARYQHARWGEPLDVVGTRRAEDQTALALLGATPLWLDVPDCIYRGRRYASEAAIFGPVAPDEAALVDGIATAVAALWSTTPGATIVAPLGLGRHVDHQVTVAAAERLRWRGLPVSWYEDFPYAAAAGGAEQRQALTVDRQPALVTISDTIDRKVAAVAAYASQVPVLFGSADAMAGAVRRYAALVGGEALAERFWSAVD